MMTWALVCSTKQMEVVVDMVQCISLVAREVLIQHRFLHSVV